MKKLIYIISILFGLSSCDTSKEYKYIETEMSKSYLGGFDKKDKETQIFKSKNDSTAILDGYRKFYISEKISKDISEYSGLGLSTPLSFKLFNEEGVDIVKNNNFLNIESEIKSVRERIYESVDFKKRLEENKKEDLKKRKENLKIDSLKIKELKPFFNITIDEFDVSGKEWYKPKSAPKFVNRNGIYFYFQVNDDVPSNLRLQVQYHSDDWLFFNKVQFSIDGKPFEYIPRDTETDSGNGGRIWEWFDDSMGKSNTELLNTILKSKTIKMKLVGSQYYDIQTLSKNQVRDLKRTLELFKSMGGEF